jgi:DNA replication protein DnaC
MEIVPKQGARPCICRRKKVRAAKLAAIPPQFQTLTLNDLLPDLKRHPQQPEIVAALKSNPFGNYFFGGKFGTGKTLFMWVIYREAVVSDRRTVVCTLSELLNEYKAFIQASSAGQELKYPRISAETLRQTHTRYSIFLDDIDKARPTEYAAEQLFEIADAIYAYQHQIVVTTNLSISNLVAHFERADDRFGGAIVRRLVDSATRFELF